MSNSKTDRDLLVEIHTDMRWVKDKTVDHDSRITAVEKKVWGFSAVLASLVGLWEWIKK